MSLIKKINDPNGKKYDDFSIGSLVLDTEPIPGSFNPVTSDGVKNAIDDSVDAAKAEMQEKIDEVTLDPSAVALGNVHLLDEVTEFHADGCILVDSETNGPGEMSKDTLLELTAQNTLAGNVALEFVPNETNAKACMPYAYGGKVYVAEEDYNGEWDASKFEEYNIGDFVLNCTEQGKNADGGNAVVNVVSGNSADLLIPTSVIPGESILVRVDGPDGVIPDNRMTVHSRSFYKSGNVENFGTVVTEFGKWFEITPTIKADMIRINRDTSIGSGTLVANVIPKRTLYNYVMDRLSDLHKEVFGGVDTKNYNLSNSTSGYYYDKYGNLVSYVDSSYIDIPIGEEADGDKILIKVKETTTLTNSRCYVLCDDNGDVVWYIQNGVIARDYNYEILTPIVHEGYTLKCSYMTVEPPTIGYVYNEQKSVEYKVESKYIKYVAPNGSDSNDGSAESPFKTVSFAVKSGAETVILREGVYNDNMLDLSTSLHDKITIKGEVNKRVIFKKANSLLVNSGEESLVSGYSKVYSVASSSPGYGTSAAQWLFFDGLADASQAIAPENAHPLERGLLYRNDCTKIVKVTAETLDDALTEIENAEENVFKWFYDSGKLYFNRADSTSVYPIYRSTGEYLTTRENQSLVMSNIEFRYGTVYLRNLNIVELYNVASKYVYGYGCFVYDNCISGLFDHCEASTAFRNTTGDGFNGNTAQPISDYAAKYGQLTLRECWAHDCQDDGYSTHEYGEVTIDGGLYENNGKAGVTPAYGTHCVCKNVTSRNNRKNGFYYTGTAIDNGNAGQMMCYNCVSSGNNANGYANTSGYNVDGDYNSITLVNCVSINDRSAFRSRTATNKAILINCSYTGADLSVKAGDGVFEVVNATPVT